MEEINHKGNPVSFLLFPKLNEWLIYICSAAFIIAAFYVQFFIESMFIGYLLLFISSIMLMFRGIDKRAFNKTLLFCSEWEPVSEETLKSIPEMFKKLKRWDISFFELSSFLGWLVFLGIAGISVILIKQDSNYTILGIDILVLFIPLYLSGMAKIDIKPTVINKIDKILMLSNHCKDRFPDCKVEFLMIRSSPKKEEKKIPNDVKIKIMPTCENNDFLGIYGQCNMNSVSGTLYPYLYFVIVFKDTFMLPHQLTDMQSFANVMIEKTSEKGVNVIVIRQITTRTSGYETTDKAIKSLLEITMMLYRKIISK